MGITKALLHTEGNKPLERNKWIMQQTEGGNWTRVLMKAGGGGI